MATKPKNPADLVGRARQGIEAEVSRIRTVLEEAQEEREWLQSAMLPPDEAKQRLEAYVDEQAATLDCSAVASAVFADRSLAQELQRLFTFTRQAVAVPLHDNASTVEVSVELAPMLCRLAPDLVKAMLTSQLEALDYTAGPPAAERPAMIEELDQRIDQLERAEEELITESELAGFDIPRREDCRPEVVLGLEVVEEEYHDEPKMRGIERRNPKRPIKSLESPWIKKGRVQE